MQILLKSLFHIFVIENLSAIQQIGDDFLNQRTQINLNYFTHLLYVYFTLLFSVIIGSAFNNALFILASTKRHKLNTEKANIYKLPTAALK